MAREPQFVVKYSSYLGTAIKLVLYILKQLFASVSVNGGGYLPRRSGSVNIHRHSPPLRRIIVKYPEPMSIRVRIRSFFIQVEFHQRAKAKLFSPLHSFHIVLCV